MIITGRYCVLVLSKIGLMDKPLFLFVCIENSCRSQMAQGLFNSLTNKAVAESAGTLASGVINPMAIGVMRERGIDVSSQHSKKLTPAMVEKAYKVVTMGCVDGCPYAAPEKVIKWNIPDPKGREKDFFVSVMKMIEADIIALLKEQDLF